jgi:hypothetical protein
MAEDVDNGVGRVQDVSIVGEICARQHAYWLWGSRSVPWMVMKVVSMVAS